ncbi:Metallo-dependent hydrolase [Ascodesmis nigricans]|uniref:Metallo-dependent hydrolase n=1 Tax=Ascodesmis nigricans TaxID=341454 RepID=A0A4S2MYW8_9PEZI|nr:Metallo-dependent hydrolase [Ascodesmis nigricans]
MPSSSDIPWHLGIHDAHCHPTDTPTTLSLIPSLQTTTLTIMSTRFEDQPLVASTASQHPTTTIPSFGHHPWFSYLLYDSSSPHLCSLTSSPAELKKAHYTHVLHSAPSDDFLALLPAPTELSTVLDELRERLQRFPNALVGEIGMDRGFRLPLLEEPVTAPGATPLRKEGQRLSDYRVTIEHQKTVFEAQLRVAGELGRAVSVHGVGCHGAVFEVMRGLWKGRERQVERWRERRRRRRKVAEGEYEFLPDMAESDFEDDEDGEDGDGEKMQEKETRSRVESSRSYTPQPFPPRLCLHSFSAPLQQLEQWLKPPSPTTRYPSDVFFSFSTTINASPVRGHLSKVEELIKRVPENAVLVESDLHTAGPEIDKALAEAVRFVCRVRGWGMEDGVRRLARNWRRFVYGDEEGGM